MHDYAIVYKGAGYPSKGPQRSRHGHLGMGTLAKKCTTKVLVNQLGNLWASYMLKPPYGGYSSEIQTVQ